MKGTYYKTPIVCKREQPFLIGKPPNLRIAKLFTTFVRYYERISKNIYGRRGKAAFRALLRIPRALAPTSAR